MNKQKIHPEGPTFSRVTAGAWRWNLLPPAEVPALVRAALDLGITTFDHADIYGDYSNEEIFGRALLHEAALKQQMQIVTKCGIKLMSGKKPEHRIKHYDTSREHIVSSAEHSLKLLGVEKIDLLLLHRPDPLMNVDEVATAFQQLRSSGKVLHFGVSNFTPSQFELLQSVLPFPLVTNQIELSLFHHAPLFDGTIDSLYKRKASAMAWSPLGGGKLLDPNHDTGRKALEQARPLMEKHQANLSQLLLAWLMHHPSNVFPVVGTGKAERLREAAHAVNISLDRQDWFEMLKWARGADVP